MPEQRRGGGEYLYKIAPVDKVDEHDSMPRLMPTRNSFMLLVEVMSGGIMVRFTCQKMSKWKALTKAAQN